jgi:hypothetical protein
MSLANAPLQDLWSMAPRLLRDTSSLLVAAEALCSRVLQCAMNESFDEAKSILRLMAEHSSYDKEVIEL